MTLRTRLLAARRLGTLAPVFVAPLLLPADSVGQATPLKAIAVETFGPELPGGTGGVTVDAEGNVYVSDFGPSLGLQATGSTIFRITPSGDMSVFAEGFVGASGSKVSPDGVFFQSNIRGNSISRVDADGTVSTYVDEGISSPVGIIFAPDGTLFVANCGDGTVQRVSSAGLSETFAADPALSCPNGITQDASGNLYVANFNDGNVVKITPEGVVSVLATLPGGNLGHLVHRVGYLYVVARGAHQIYRVSLEGDFQLIAGSGERGHQNGSPLESSFSYPNDLDFSPDGRWLYVNEIQATDQPHTQLSPMVVRRIRMGH